VIGTVTLILWDKNVVSSIIHNNNNNNNNNDGKMTWVRFQLKLYLLKLELTCIIIETESKPNLDNNIYYYYIIILY
jgi:hypothetical protein